MTLTHYKNTGRVLFGFTVKKNIKQAVIIGVMASILIATSAVGYANAYPTTVARKLASVTFADNTGLRALLGPPQALETVAGFTAWRSLGSLLLIVGIWAIFISTRLFRGDEEQGRLELILTGKSTLKNATLQIFAALGIMLVPAFLLITIATIAVSQAKDFGWQLSSASFLALTIILTGFMFMCIGAVMSQIVATRAAAIKFTAAIFGISFLLRSLGDISGSASWLSAISPLGWIERLRPLTDTNIIWLVPILLTIVGCIVATAIIAKRRDYDTSILPDKDSASPNYRLLHSGNALLVRLHKNTALLWVSGLFLANFMFGTFLSAANKALDESGQLQNTLNKITNGSTINSTTLFIGVIFLMMILLLLTMVAGQINNYREEEARGYLDNLLVRQSSRLSLTLAKICLIVASIIIAAAAVTLGSYLGMSSQHISIGTWPLLSAGINMTAVPILLLGVGILFFGFVPRLISVVLYTIIGWAFVIEIVGSVINLSHWVLDTSLLHHIALAPALAVRWDTFWAYISLGILMAIIGTWRFTKRDIELM